MVNVDKPEPPQVMSIECAVASCGAPLRFDGRWWHVDEKLGEYQPRDHSASPREQRG